MKKIMHIASFKGNAGDIVNHEGFYKILKDVLIEEFTVNQIEVREFYRNSLKRKFDNEFLSEINSYDLLILGGGAFFDARWIESKTGTTFDMDNEFIDGIKIPVLVNAMGYLETLESSEDNSEVYKLFEKFLTYITSKENWLVTVRNDESFKRIEDRYTKSLSSKITKVADNGLFYTDKIPTKKNDKVNTIGLNITNDLFSKSFNNDMTTDKFNDAISNYITKLIDENKNLILFAHAPQDLNTINIIMSKIGAEKFREKITVAPYRPSDVFGVDELIKYYKMCDIVIAMRFHANILALQLGIPTVGLSGHNQIKALYNELALEEYFIKVDSDDFINKVMNTIELISKKEYVEKANNSFAELEELKALYKEKLNDFLNK